MEFFSGNEVLKESRDNWSQKAGHVGVPTFGGRCGNGVVVDDCGEVALTPGLRSQGQLGASGKRLRTRRHDATRNACGGSSGQLGRASGRGCGDQAGMRGAGRGV